MSETIWTCDKCGSIMPTGSIAAHAEFHRKQDAKDIEGLHADAINRTRIPPPSTPPEATLLDRLAALSTWLGEFPFQAACVTGERTINEAIGRIEEMEGFEVEATDANFAIDGLVGKGVDALSRLGLSKVPDAGSLKRDEAWDAVPMMEAAIIGQRERIAYLEELNRRMERYAAFDADGFIAHEGQAFISVECKNCGRTFPQSRAAYEQLQRQTHERNGRVDL